MAARAPCWLLIVAVLFVSSGPIDAAGPPWTTERLIDALADVPEGNFAESLASGEGFLPLRPAGKDGAGRTDRLGREAMLELVRRGPRAVPHLIARLGDTRRTRIIIRVAGGFGLIDRMPLDSTADHNPRTQEPRREPSPAQWEQDGVFLWVKQHTVTVGDLCYVALGQIVNRDFSAGGFVGHGKLGFSRAASTALSPHLRRQVIEDWKGLTAEGHRASLVNDFVTPDSIFRRIGAAKRLAYYHPRDLESLALAFLARRTYPAVETEKFVHGTLYKTAEAWRRKELLDGFVKRHGPASREGVLLQLFSDLRYEEIMRESEYGGRPKALLIELFGRGEGVRGEDVPYPDAVSDQEKAWLVEALVHDPSEKIDRAVLALLRSCGDNDEMALACMARLVGRGYDADIERHCKRRLKGVAEDDAEDSRGRYARMIGRLGYTRLHVVAERGVTDTARQLLARGASPAARSRDGKTPLHLAVEHQHLDTLRVLAATRRGLDLKDREGHTAVEMALERGDDEAVRVLADAGCTVNNLFVAALADLPERAGALLRADPAAIRRVDGSKCTALHLAARWGNTRTMAVLLRHGADVKAGEGSTRTALYEAAREGRAEAVRLLLAHKADVKGGADSYQAISLAAHGGHIATVKILLRHGADINAAFWPPLHIAIDKGDLALAAVLLGNGAKVDIEYDGTPLHRAVEAGNAGMVRLLLRHRAGVGVPALHLAAIRGSDTIADLLIRAGAKADAVHGDAGTALHAAAKAGNAAVVRLLLARKADVSIPAKNDGTTALHHAARHGDAAMVAALLKAGASVRAADAEKHTPLHAAGSVAVAVRLLDAGADVNVRAADGKTALHAAAAGGDIELAEALLARRASVDVRDADKLTPLLAALRVARLTVTHKAGDMETEVSRNEPMPNAFGMANLLLRHGADVNAKDADGLTPLHWAALADDVNLVRLLLSRKADPKSRDGNGRNPLALALAAKNPRVAELLRRFTPKK